MQLIRKPGATIFRLLSGVRLIGLLLPYNLAAGFGGFNGARGQQGSRVWNPLMD
jgi:hypothetical protein